MNIRRILRLTVRQAVKHPVAVTLFLLAVSYLAAVTVIAICEEATLDEAVFKSLPAFLGELGQVESKSTIVKTAIGLSLVLSIAFVTILTARVTSLFVELCRKGGIIVKQVNFSDHVIICGWNFQGNRIVRELLQSADSRDKDIVILADCEERPVQDDRVEFISGDPTQDADLIRAGVKRADSVIVLTDFRKNANEADAEALMIVLAVESLQRKAHTCVQILNSANRVHLERAHADEIVCLDQMGGSLVVASALNHGVSRIVQEMLTFDHGSEFHRYDRPLSDDIVGKEFSEVVKSLAGKRMLLVGFETKETEELKQSLAGDILHTAEEGGRVIVINPQGRYTLRQGDALFLIAEEKPASL